MSALVSILPHYTYDDFCQWEGRWEIINGIPYAMSPAPSFRHQFIASNIRGELRNALKLTSCDKCRAYDFIDIKITEDTVVQPDVSIICGRPLKAFLDFPPAIVVEILSPATRLKDRTIKFDLYEQFGVSYFMLVDVETDKIDIFHLADGKTYTRQSPENTNSFTFHLQDQCDIALSLNKIWE